MEINHRKNTELKKQYKTFGKHLTIDAHGINRKKLENHKEIFVKL